MNKEIKKGEIFPIHDVCKSTLLYPKFLLDSVNLWPEQKNNKMQKIIIAFIAITYITSIVLQLAYLLENFDDILEITNVMSTISITIQGLAKMPTLFIYSKSLRKILHHVWYDFWKANSTDKKTEMKIKKQSILILACFFFEFVPAFVYNVGNFTVTLSRKDYMLPFPSKFPFDHKQSPTFEILFVLQLWANLFLNVSGICGHDFLYLALVGNVIAQFKLLKNVLTSIGSENENQDDKEFLVVCVKHHKLLLEIGNELKNIFSFASFVQLFCSTVAICVACFILTMVNMSFSEGIHLVVYVFGHIAQIFIYCVAGNELKYQSETLTNSLYASEWYNADEKIKKDILFSMMGFKMKVNISALKLIDLDYASFIAVIKFAFSVYNLLSRMQQ